MFCSSIRRKEKETVSIVTLSVTKLYTFLRPTYKEEQNGKEKPEAEVACDGQPVPLHASHTHIIPKGPSSNPLSSSPNLPSHDVGLKEKTLS